MGLETMPKILIKQLKENENFDTTFLVSQKSVLVSKTNRPYLSLKLTDSSGEADGRVWDNVEEISALFERNDFIRAYGKPIVFQDKVQLNIVKVMKLDPESVDISDYLPVSKRNIEEMFTKLMGIVRNDIQNPWVKKFLLAIFEDPSIAKNFKRAPAAKTNHHAWVGGLLEHVLHLCELGKDVLKHYPQVNADLVYTGLMLHDIGKIYEMSYEKSFGYTDEGQLVGHLIQGVEMVYDKIRGIPDFPEKIKTHIVHLILAHHGRLEFGSPKLPMTMEAIMVHYLDDMDSKLQGVMDLAAKEANLDSGWVSFNRLFGRPMYIGTQKDLNVERLEQSPSERPKKSHKEPLTTNLGSLLQKSTR